MADQTDALKTEDDVDEVLKLALRMQGRSDPDLRARLLAAAEELGISREELAQAEAEYARSQEEGREFLEFKRRQIREFREHFFTYIVINTLLVVINWIVAGTVNWAIWPILGWGVGLALHAWGSLNTGSESFNEDFQNFRRRQAKRRAKQSHGAKIVTGVGSIASELDELGREHVKDD